MNIKNTLLCHQITVDNVYVKFKRAMRVFIHTTDNSLYVASVPLFNLEVTRETEEKAFVEILKLLVTYLTNNPTKQVTIKKIK